MAGGLDISNSQVVKFLDDFGLHIWNKGGQGLTSQVFDNAFGKVSVFGRDSVRLDLVDELGTTIATQTVLNAVTSLVPSPGNVLPNEYSLEQNYPNPFNPATSIRYTLGERTIMSLVVYNTLGQRMAVLVDGVQDAGIHTVRLDASRFASGVYVYRMRAGKFEQSRKLVIIR
jgi:hypothetical protein